MPAGPLPTGMVWATTWFTGSIRETVPASTFAAQSEPSPPAIAPGDARRGISPPG
jgi:hypothetical protein